MITNAEGAGYNVQVAEDGQEIIYRETKIENNLRTNNIVRMNLYDTKRSVIAYSQRNFKKMVLSNYATSVTIEDQKIILMQNGKETILTPNGDEHSYIWPSISPDGTKLCYYVSGVGCYVSNIDGSNPQYIARDCRAAKWYNNTTLVAMADEDDGYFITASSIVVYTLDGNFQELTSKDLLAMYPQVSSGKITFSTVKGETYLLNVR
jgi:Tol biopolymer transport system component